MAVLGFSISTFVCIYWFLTCLHQSTHFVVVQQMWIFPLMPDSPKNSNRSWTKLHWIDEDEWDRKEFGGRRHRIIIDRMLVLVVMKHGNIYIIVLSNLKWKNDIDGRNSCKIVHSKKGNWLCVVNWLTPWNSPFRHSNDNVICYDLR